jgi:hypothetical protein
MKKIIGVIFSFCLILSYLSLSAKNNVTEVEQVALTFNELSHYFNATLQFYAAQSAFNQKYKTNIPEITCEFCPKRSLPCDELIVKIQAKAMDKAIGAEDTMANEVREKMLAIYHEITQLLFLGSMDDIRNFMAKIAQQEAIPCEDCQRVAWKAVAASKCAN